MKRGRNDLYIGKSTVTMRSLQMDCRPSAIVGIADHARDELLKKVRASRERPTQTVK